MDTLSHPADGPWYQPMLSLGWGSYGTAADVVADHFDFKPLYDLEAAYHEARADLDRKKERVRLLMVKIGWDLPSGVRVACPLMLKALLDVLPTDEPVDSTSGLGGRPATPFTCLLRAFVLAPFYEVEDNSEAIWRALANNPRYLERCQFPDHKLPDVRVFQRFNEVMNYAELWAEARRRVVRSNIEGDVVSAPRRLAIDPGHEDGYAGVRRPCAACRSCGACERKEQVPTCDVTDLVTKRRTYQFPGVKGVFVANADDDMPMHAAAVNARRSDGRTGAETAQVFAAEYPELVDGIEEVLLDGAYDIADEKAAISEALGGADVLTPINPRNRKAQSVEDSRGIDHIDPYGVPHCIAGQAMDYKGRDQKREQYIYGCPSFDSDTGTLNCDKQGQCCPNLGRAGRRFRVDRARTPQVDWDNPQHSADYKRRYNGRTSVERVIGRTKRSFPFERHWGRGRASFQGHLDKGVLAFHVLASAAHAAGMPERSRSALTFHREPRQAAA